MAVRDTEAFIREKAEQYDPNIDLTSGAPFDKTVIQPIVRRFGQDPFSVDLSTFLNDRLEQAYPELATKEGDAVTDLLNKPVTLLWDPIVREITLIKQMLSFKDPTVLTVEEAEALGANLFSERETGDLSRGVARVYFNSPQNAGISPANFITSKTGLHFFPQEIQSIRTEEMLLNIDEDGVYYFDINVIAESAGSQYDIAANNLVTIANVPAATRVKNLRRFSRGVNEETAVEFSDRAKQELTERSLVTLRGIGAKITKAFPEVRRLNAIGMNDPEMQRDVITGGGLGDIVAMGVAGVAVTDGEYKVKTKRFRTTEVDFTSIIGPTTVDPSNFVLTVFDAFAGTPVAMDLDVEAVIGANEIDVDSQLLIQATSSLRWTIRRKELTLSGIPGGILFPDSPYGTVTIEDDEVHVGGMTDIHVRGTDFNEETLILDAAADDGPLLSGLDLEVTVVGTNYSTVRLNDIVLDVDYVEDDATYLALERMEVENLTLTILTGPNVGNYRVLTVTQATGLAPVITITPLVSVVGSGYRWRVTDELDVDLVEPKETRISDSDLQTYQASDIVGTAAGTDFNELGVAEGDILRIDDGEDAGDHTLAADPIAPGYTTLQLDAPLTSTNSGLSYTIFRSNQEGGIDRPIIRIKSVEVLDSSGQPQGTTIPYAKPVDIQSRAFQNPARGVKHDLADVQLGLVSVAAVAGSIAMGGTTVDFNLLDGGGTSTVTFSGPTLPIATIISELNTQLLAAFSVAEAAVLLGTDRVGIRPFGPNGKVAVVGGSAMAGLFGSATQTYTSMDVRSSTVDLAGGWDSLDPNFDHELGLDVLQVLDGYQIGFYRSPYTLDYISGLGPALASDALLVANSSLTSVTSFAPEVSVRMQIGARSIGSARCYFLEPTTIEFDQDSFFSVEIGGSTVRFFPDPTLTHQVIPPLPGDDTPTDGSANKSTPSGIFTSASSNFLLSDVKLGDELVIEHFPIGGTVSLADPVVGLVGKTFIFSINNETDRMVTFIRDDVSLPVTDVSRQGVVDQINSIIGLEVCSLTGTNELVFDTDFDFVIRTTGTANTDILLNIAGTTPALPFASADSTQRSNRSPHFGRYEITDVGITTVTAAGGLSAPSPTYDDFDDPIDSQRFKIERPGSQRISTTDMDDNEAEANLYYFDVELVSEGTGDLWNIAAAEQLTATGFRSDGYYLTVSDENLTFSEVEPVSIHISKSILENGVDDDPQNATQLAGQNIQITYDRAALVADVQNYISSETERVICSNPLGRHLIPYFVRTDINYVGGSSEEVTVPELEQYILDLYAVDLMEVSDVVKIFTDRGATSVTNPIDLIAVVHGIDRSILAERSQNALGTGRLSAFVPDVLNVTRSVS
jgi:hypothetical protein